MPELKKELSYPVILLITINSIIGTGIFFLPAIGAGHAGAASIIAWVVLSIVAIYISMCFGELTSMFPTAGGIYEFCKQAYGRFISFIIGWTSIVTGNITIAMLAVGAVKYISGGLPENIQLIICVTFILLFNLMAYLGLKTSSTMLVAFSVITLSSVIGLILPGFLSLNISNFEMAMPSGQGIAAVLVTIFLIAETFFGWETATFLAGETKDGRKVMPKALIHGTIIIAVVSLLFVITSLGNIHWSVFGRSETPLIDLAHLHYGDLGTQIFGILVYLSIMGSVAGWIVSSPRLVLAMAEDKLMLSQLSKIHPTRNTPMNAILFQAIFSIFLVFVGFSGENSYQTLLHLLLPLVLVLYSVVIFSLVVLRKKMPEYNRYYKVPFARFGPHIVIFFLLFLIFMWYRFNPSGAKQIFLLGGSFVYFGVPLYFLIALYHDPKMIRSVRDILAYFVVLTEIIFVPHHLKKTILDELGDVRHNTILEFGCSVGTITIDLAKAVGPSGKIYAVDFSKQELRIAQKRIERDIWASHEQLHGRVHVIHDENHLNGVHPMIPYADCIVSLGTLSYLQDIDKVLKEMSKITPEGGKICFVEYVDFYKLIPNVGWMSDENKLEAIFRKAGFSVEVHKKKGWLWNYLIIRGVKSGRDVPFV